MTTQEDEEAIRQRVIDENKASDVTVSPNYDRARKIIAEHLLAESDRDKVVPTAHVIDDLGADSLDVVELTMAFEEEFGIEITDDESENNPTVADIIRLIDKKVSERG